jgi:HAD superfamily hydrolase (TIGR01509 family)
MNSTLVIFDMDGTLTRDQLDFDAIRLEIGLEREPILEALERMSPADRARAEAILHRHEAAAADTSELQPGAAGVLADLRRRGIAVALMTRNSRRSAETFLARHGLAFDRVRTREDGAIKPSPAPVVELCAALRRSPGDAWVVGDFHYDLICGRQAGARTILLWDRPVPLPDWAAQADHVIRQLSELLACMELKD